jgi:alkanesulfonate monooxygenase SsuD/methylene tetrahydromethanopterin reductase-like flavin-dependent oxidoreductase (luciferase family)
LRSSGRSRPDFTYATAAFVIVGDTEQERARNAEAVRQQIAFYASTRTYEPVLASHGWEGIAPELHHKSLQGDWQGMAALITDEMLDTIAVTGTWETIVPKLRERYAGLLDRIALYQPYEVAVDDSRLARLAQQLNYTQ